MYETSHRHNNEVDVILVWSLINEVTVDVIGACGVII